MSRYVEDAARRVKEATDIVELIASVVPLTKVGTRFRALCPFHHEKTPSFYVNPQSQFFYCFGCHKGGDVFDFIRAKDQLAFPDALAVLAKRAGLTIERAPTEQGGRRERLRGVLEAAGRRYQEHLAGPLGRGAREYLARRNILPKTVADFGLGLAHPDWQDMLNHLQSQRFTTEEIEAAGLARRKEAGGHFDLFRGRLMIPIHDGQGRLRGFGGRVLDDGTPKYLNSPETELFQKKSLLYAFHAARPQILQSRRAIIMEGYMDVILAHQQGVKEAVAALGTSFTDEHATQLRRNADHVVLVFDGDAAGLSAAERSLPILLAQGLQVSVVVIPGGQDPGDLFASGQTERFQELLASGARDAVDFLLDRALERHGQQGLAGRVQAGKQVIELLGTLRDPLQRELFVKRIAERLGVSESTVLKSERAAAPAPRAGALRDPEPAAPVNRSPRERAERECLAALLQDHELRAAIVSDLRIEDFTATAHQRLLALLQAEPASPDSPGDLLDRLREDGELSGLVVELVESVAVVNGRAVVSELLSRTRRAEQWQELRGLKQQWQEHGGQGQGGGEDDLLRAYLERLKGLKSARGRSAEV